MVKKAKSYSAKDIEILSGLNPVRKRPEMYTDTVNPTHLAHEVIDNSVDEAMSGYASHVKVMLYKDQSLAVEDNGRGLPMDLHPIKKVSGAEVILTTLHSGSKFSGSQYRFSGGLHGVGVSVVNALSSHLEARIQRGRKIYHLTFKDGKKKRNTQKSVAKSASGTRIHFTPDPKYFDSAEFDKTALRELLRTKAILCSGLRMDLKIEGEKKESWCYQDGMVDYFNELTANQSSLLPENYSFDQEVAEHQFKWCFNWFSSANQSVGKSYVNLIPTIQGGVHTNGLRSGLTDALREFIHLHKLGNDVKIKPEDVWKDIFYILSVHTPEPRFAGQTKEKFVSKDVGRAIEKSAYDDFSLWLNKNISAGKSIVENVFSNAQLRSREAKKRNSGFIQPNAHLPSKLSDCLSSDINENELFLVEGNSAGGSAKQARQREYQAVMALRGKILNTWESNTDVILESKEVADIVGAIGVRPGEDDLSRLRYGKICILSDADSDGFHISVLLSALFLKHFRPLINAGHIYVALPPLFRIDCGNSVYYAHDEKDRDTYMNKLSDKEASKARILRFKGLGEMNPKQLRESTMLPAERHLIQLTTDDTSESMLDMLLAKQRAGDRREWLSEKGNLVEVG